MRLRFGNSFRPSAWSTGHTVNEIIDAIFCLREFIQIARANIYKLISSSLLANPTINYIYQYIYTKSILLYLERAFLREIASQQVGQFEKIFFCMGCFISLIFCPGLVGKGTEFVFCIGIGECVKYMLIIMII